MVVWAWLWGSDLSLHKALFVASYEAIFYAVGFLLGALSLVFSSRLHVCVICTV